MPIHTESEEEDKNLKMPNKAEEEIEDWDGHIKEQKEPKVLELKNNNVTIPQSSPKFQFTSTTDMDDIVEHTPQMTHTLVPLGNEEQKEDHLEDASAHSEDYDSENTIDNIG